MTVSDKSNVKNICTKDLAPSTQRADSVQSNPRNGGFKSLGDWRRLLTADDRWQASSLFISSPPCRELSGSRFCKSGNQGSRSHSQPAASSRMLTAFPDSKLNILEPALSYLHSLPLSCSPFKPSSSHAFWMLPHLQWKVSRITKASYSSHTEGLAKVGQSCLNPPVFSQTCSCRHAHGLCKAHKAAFSTT